MNSSGYGLTQLVADLRVIIAEAADLRDALEQALPLAEWVAQEPANWLHARRFETSSEKGFGTNLLHDEPDDDVTVCIVAWPPGGRIVPHDHHSWEILSPVYGMVRHSSWTRPDDGLRSGESMIQKRSEIVMRPGQATSVMPQEIHGLENLGPGPALTMHIYGCKLAEVERSRFIAGESGIDSVDS
jgi:predicted metal-dependent enzyme (double-stranded beta helix superfamily)